MSNKLKYKGQSYQRINGDWHDASFIRVPRTLAQQLDALAGVKRQPSPPQPTKKRKTAPSGGDGDSAFSHADVFPFIAQLIHQLDPQNGDFVTHRQLAEALLHHPEARTRIEDAIARKGHTPFDWSHWMVQWFSAAITTNNSPYANDFQRRRQKDGWAYRPAQRDS